MRHGKKFNHLSRKSAHRKALLANLAIALIEHKRIRTTLAKAKALRKYVEPLITKSKSDTTHSRRIVFSYLQNKHAISELFGPVANKIADRPGGYTRILRTGIRQGDSAQMCIIELVDFNETYQLEKKEAKKKRSRRGSAKSKSATSDVKNEKQNQENVEKVKDKPVETKPVETKPVETKEVETKAVEEKKTDKVNPAADEKPADKDKSGSDKAKTDPETE